MGSPISVGIAVMAYSRPGHLASVISSLSSSGVDRFSVYIDGADDKAIREKQDEIIRMLSKIQWATVNIVHRPINMGLRRSIVSAVTEELKVHDAVILLEDDTVPNASFFNFMHASLNGFKDNKKIKSVCGYQFPHIEGELSASAIQPVAISRFVPWGWATWRDRWDDYDTDLKNLVECVHHSGKYNSLPRDIKHYLESKSAFDDANDIWSINWVLSHFLTDSLCVFPTTSLIENIGFDGTGVHCFETDAFVSSISPSSDSENAVEITSDVDFNPAVDASVKNYMEEHWGKTMVAGGSGKDKTLITVRDIEEVVSNVVKSSSIVDIHTHLFPEVHEGYYLAGLDELLNYHYLTVETFRATGVDPNYFYSLSKSQRAEFVWNSLFVEATPLSEATRGVATVLDFFGIKAFGESYPNVKEMFRRSHISHDALLERLGIEKIVMTNDPFNVEEWTIFSKEGWDRDRYLAALRLDTLFFDTGSALAVLREKGFVRYDEELTAVHLVNFLNAVSQESRPKYVALSVDGSQLPDLISNPLFCQALLPWLKDTGLPLALMIGVKRSVNPQYRLGGDGLGDTGLAHLEQLVRSYPEINFMVTHLHDVAQHEVTVLTRKFSNIKLFGFWWFINQPSLIQRTLNMRLDMLGGSFIPQHSDARIFEQLIFKWHHFKTQLQDVLVERYKTLAESGWVVDEEVIARDVKKLLHDNAMELIR